MFLKHLYSTDHKIIGLLYGFTSLFFLLVGFLLVIIIRWSSRIPVNPCRTSAACWAKRTRLAASSFRSSTTSWAPCTAPSWCSSAFVPLAVGAFGNYLIPLQIGAPDMAFPRLNLASYWFYAAAGAVMLVSFFVPGGAANKGWTSYPPLSDLAPGNGQTLWLVGMLLLIFSSLRVAGERSCASHWALSPEA